MHEAELPAVPRISEAAVRDAAHKMNPNSALCPDRMQPGLLRLLATTGISPEAGVSGLSTLTRLVVRLASAEIPPPMLPIIAAATIIHIKARRGKIQPIAIGQALRHLTTKVLLAPALSECSDYLAPQQKANWIRNSVDAIVRDARMLYRPYGSDSSRIMFSDDASDAFHTCSRSRMLHCLPEKASTLARFIDAIYGKIASPLFVPASPRTLLRSEESTQQGDSAGILLFSRVIRSFILEIEERCNLDLNR